MPTANKILEKENTTKKAKPKKIEKRWKNTVNRDFE